MKFNFFSQTYVNIMSKSLLKPKGKKDLDKELTIYRQKE